MHIKCHIKRHIKCRRLSSKSHINEKKKLLLKYTIYFNDFFSNYSKIVN